MMMKDTLPLVKSFFQLVRLTNMHKIISFV